jgi:threonine dehydrogenase-like Zn-dependent dehydrogenase
MFSLNASLPATQYAVQLTGPGRLVLNREKPVEQPTGYQMLCKVEATGLCFSDLKLLKQFTDHPRKSEVVRGLDDAVMRSMPSYVPGDKPTVPGHETVVRIVAVGDQVREHRVGERCLVQTDYRDLATAAGSNAAFGYNIEGGLQEYVIIDERVSRDFATGERLLIPVGPEKSASAVCLVEPWACVEDSYRTSERRTIRSGGRLLVVADSGHSIRDLAESFAPEGAPSCVTVVAPDAAQRSAIESLGLPFEVANSIESLPEKSFDDIVYFGATPSTIEAINTKSANRCILNIVTAGRRIGAPVPIGVGRIHYGMTRWIGTFSNSAVDAYATIPETGEVRLGDRCLVMGAGGPMGQMHVIRDLCNDVRLSRMVATDFDSQRLESLRKIVTPMADRAGVELLVANPKETPIHETFTYVAVMVPIAPLVAEGIAQSAPGCLVNIFAGIAAPTIHPIDLDAVIERRVFLFGTSGSTLNDMKIVLEKVQSGRLDTNCSVDAVAGMAGATDGIAAVENRTLAGKIIVYPELHELALTPLASLAEKFPSVAEQLEDGRWTLEAERELLRVAR